jgi:diguanylate cyclase (GGDEF)-like protein
MMWRQAERTLHHRQTEADGQSRRHSRDQHAPLGHQPVSSADDGAADLAAGLAEMGLSHKAAWYSGALLYGVGGLLTSVLYAFSLAVMPRGVFYLGVLAMVIAMLCLLAGRYVTDIKSLEWTTHARLISGLAIYVTAVIMLKDSTVAFALLPLLTVPTPCYLYTWRFALPYIVAAASIVCVGLLLTSGTARLAHALISTFAFVMIATSMIVIKQRTRMLARHNRLLAFTDPLTGIANMRSLRERISAEPGRVAGGAGPFALFAMDLDNFKQVNDRFDHSVGDTVLCAVSGALAEEINPGDLVVRRGGDEFSVLVRDPSVRDLDELRNRLEGAIARARVATCPQVTPSGTVAYICSSPGEEIGATMERADEALRDVRVKSRDRRRSETSYSAPTVDIVDAESAHPTGRTEERSEHGADGRHTWQARSAGRFAMAVTRAIGRSDPVWGLAAFLFGLTGIAIGAVSVGHMVEPLTPAGGVGIAVGFAALAVTCVWGGGSGWSEKWLHLPWVAAYVLVGFAVILAGPSGTALLDLLPLIVLYGFLLFGTRTAALYMFVGQGTYAAVAIGGGLAHGVARAVITTVMVAVVSGLIVKLRVLTLRFARTNRELSELDALTGVGNARALRGRIVNVIERASSQDLHPMVVAIDLDDFKQVNDAHSHFTGDRVLTAVARAVSERVRIGELVARRGGDEFVVVIDDADSQYADAVVKRIDDAIVRTRSRICPDLRPTASVASVRWRPGETPDDLLHEADIALHARKAESRLGSHRPLTASRSEGPARRGLSRRQTVVQR